MSHDLDPSLSWLDALKFGADGTIPVIARETLAETARTGRATYWSRSRNKVWRKGEESGHFQHVKEMRADCDGDVVLLSVEQEGGIACHTGRESCFFYRREGDRWIPADPVLKDPKEIYAK